MRVLYTEQQIAERVRALARQLDATYADSEDLVLVGVLRGAVYFLSDLSRAMTVPHRLDFVEYVSYRGTEKRRGQLVKRCTDPTERSDVVLVDEILDTGETTERLKRAIARGQPRTIATCVLLWKEGVSRLPPPDFFGFSVGPEFLIGYGLDHDQRYRQLPYVAIL
jgi:hypoxanthine phosphoribosyltransferase